MADAAKPSARPVTLVTDPMCWADVVRSVGELVGVLLPHLGSGAVVEVHRIDGSGERRSATVLTAATLRTHLAGSTSADAPASLWTEIQARGANGSVLLCNDLDLQVESRSSDVLRAARAWLAAAGLRVHESMAGT